MNPTHKNEKHLAYKQKKETHKGAKNNQHWSNLSRHNSAHARDGASVQTADPLLGEDAPETVPGALVQRSVLALHARLHHVDGVVAKHTGTAGDETAYHGGWHAELGLAAVREDIFVGVKDHEAQALVGTLLQDSGQ